MYIEKKETIKKKQKNSMFLPGAQVRKSVHPASKLCTPGAGCTLNFGHCYEYIK